MGRGATALLGAVAGGAAGVAILLLTQPTAAYTNDAYRGGASVGYVLRYVVLGLLAALLIDGLRRGGRGRGLAAVGLAVVLGLAIVPPLLDERTSSERRRAAANAIEDPAARHDATLRAGAIDGCVDSTRRQLKSAPDAPDVDPEAYCTCFIDAIVAGPEDDEAQLKAVADAARAGRPTRRMTRLAERCAAEAEATGSG